ncbi:hypothetical protein B0H17DRAFT_950783, partial [Mycena rosella]
LQFFKYFGTSRADSRGLKAFVAVVALMTYVKSIQTSVLVWAQLILHFGDFAGPQALNPFPQAFHIYPPLVAGGTITVLVQTCFCSRLYAISTKWYIGPLAQVLVIFEYITNTIKVFCTRLIS